MPPTITFPQPSTHTGIKLSKLVKEARLFGYETFSGSVDAVVVRTWKGFVDTPFVRGLILF